MITNLDGIEATIECGDASMQELRGVIDYARALLARAESAEGRATAMRTALVEFAEAMTEREIDNARQSAFTALALDSTRGTK